MTAAACRSCFSSGGQPVDACRQYRLHRRRHLDGRQGVRQPIGARLTHQHPGLHQGAHALFQEKGIALGARDEQLLERRQAGVRPQQGVEDRLGARRGQRIEPQLRIVGLTAPAVLVLRAVVDQQQQAGRGQAVDEAVEQGLGLGYRSSADPQTPAAAAAPGSRAAARA